MNGDRVQFDPHFAVTSRIGNNNEDSVQIWNRELLTPVGKFPERKGMTFRPLFFFQASSGWILIRYDISPPEAISWSPQIKESKYLGILGLGIHCAAEFPDGSILVFYTNGGPRDNLVVYNSQWIVTEEKRGVLPTVGACLALNSKTLVIASGYEIKTYSYPQLGNKRTKGLDKRGGTAKFIVRVSDSTLLVAQTYRITFWNRNLEKLRTFSLTPVVPSGEGVYEEIVGLYLLPDGRVLVVTWHSNDRMGITIFSLGLEGESKGKRSRSVEVPVTKVISGALSNVFESHVYLPETQEVLFALGKHPMKSDYLVSLDLKTLKLKKLMDFSVEFQRLVYVRWPPTKVEFEQAVKRMKTLWEGKVPIPDDLLKVVTKFLE